jgi:hypothetical protein
VISMPVPTRIEVDVERPPAPTQSIAPAIPGVIAGIEPPGTVARIIIVRRNPGLVIPARAIKQRIVINVTAGITGCIPNVNHVWSTVVDMHILHVVHG